MGLIAFANSNDDSLPKPQYAAGTSPMRAYLCYEATRPQVPLQLAQLYSEGFLGDTAKILYCPSFAAEFKSYTDGGAWGTNFLNNYIRASYLYAPMGKERDAIGLPVIKSGPRLSELEQNRCIVTDKIDTWESVPHHSSGPARGINALFPDGSVRFYNDAVVMNYDLWHPFGIYSVQGPGSSDIATRAILSGIRQ